MSSLVHFLMRVIVSITIACYILLPFVPFFNFVAMVLGFTITLLLDYPLLLGYIGKKLFHNDPRFLGRIDLITRLTHSIEGSIILTTVFTIASIIITQASGAGIIMNYIDDQLINNYTPTQFIITVITGDIIALSHVLLDALSSRGMYIWKNKKYVRFLSGKYDAEYGTLYYVILLSCVGAVLVLRYLIF